MSQHSHCHTIYYVGKFIKKRHVAKPRPSFVVDTHMREKNPFLETFLWHYLNLSQKHFQNSAFISQRGKARNHRWELWVCEKVCVRWRLCQKVWVCRRFGTEKEIFPTTPSQSLLYFSFTLLLHRWAWEGLKWI